MGNLTMVTPFRRLGLATGVLLGAIVLALLLVLAVFLPKAEGSEAVSLPDELPGGYSALDSDRTLPDDAQLPENYLASQGALIRSINSDYDDTYDEPVTFRAYADDDLTSFAIVTVFTGEGSAFGPNFGTSDGVRLSHSGDVVCYSTFAQTETGELSTDPDTVTCQLPHLGHTVQTATSGVSVDDSVKLTEDVADAI